MEHASNNFNLELSMEQCNVLSKLLTKHNWCIILIQIHDFSGPRGPFLQCGWLFVISIGATELVPEKAQKM